MEDALYVAQRSIERLHVLIVQNYQRQRRTEKLHSMQQQGNRNRKDLLCKIDSDRNKYIKKGEKDLDEESYDAQLLMWTLRGGSPYGGR